MVTSRQLTLGMLRTMRAMDRAAKQAERQRIAEQQALHRQAQLNASARAAAESDAITEALTSAHRTNFARRDWLTDATAPEVPPPERRDDAERSAARALEDYAPSWFARTFGRESKVRAQLEQAVTDARAADDAGHAHALAAAAQRNALIAFARRVIAREPDALVQALEEHSALGTLPFSVEGVRTMFVDGRVVAIVDGLDLEDMPEETVTLLKSGKASVKPLAIGKRYELHRDAICSAAVRVGIEVLATLPLDEVEVLMLTDILDRATGHIAAAPVLHLRMTAQALAAMNLGRTDAAAIVDRLGGHLDWNKREGFRAISAAAFGIALEG